MCVSSVVSQHRSNYRKMHVEFRFTGATCGSYWAHAATSAVEAAMSIQFNSTPTAFSRQQIMDCANNEVLGATYVHSSGCNEGL